MNINFEELKTDLTLFFLQRGLALTNVYNPHAAMFDLLYESEYMEVRLGYSHRGIALAIVDKVSKQWINEDDINAAYGFTTELSDTRMFSKNLIGFFSGVGSSILSGDPAVWTMLKELSHARAEAYTNKLMYDQNIAKADTAWAAQNYVEYIRVVDTMDKNQLPKSYLLKYEMAKKRQP